ncbi:MAG: hypothetical protein KGL11_07085 [Alphaproteobacteria bacterium]|nr:hypothetical protein [Alphaproteobacteria bacterium]
MKEHGLHRGLELRLEALAARIAALEQKMKRATGFTRIEDFGEVAELEQRHKALAGRLQELAREGPGFRQDVKAEIENLTDDLTNTVDDFVMWIDSDFRPDRRPAARGKP